MDYHDIPSFYEWKGWENEHGDVEVKLLSLDGDILLHLSEDEEAKEDRIENGKFYINKESGLSGLTWIRERKGIEMSDGIVDADYVSFINYGQMQEHQHNHIHLDNDVLRGKKVALTPVNN
jgi:hypothetical protein